MNVLILGSGGRECALAWKIRQSPICEKLYTAPGNGGTFLYGENVEISPLNFEDIANFSLANNIELIIVGSEEPLVFGIVDFFCKSKNLSGIRIIGPDKNGARLEGSKTFAKNFMKKYNIPTAAYQSFTSEEFEQAKQFIHSLVSPYVLKVDGLAGGKGVLICETIEEAYSALDRILIRNEFQDAGKSIVIEEFLNGIEISIFVLTDGSSFLILPEAKDYKRISDNNTGLNTGGMGTISPVPFATEDFMQKVKTKIIEPTVKGIQEEAMHYCGFIYFGLMNKENEPYVIEYNVRLGDPEAQSILPRIENDIVELFMATAEKKIETQKIKISPKTVLNVVLASAGYPQNYEKGKIIELPKENDNQIIFHAGTAIKNNRLVTAGGRVMSACGTGNNIHEAIKYAYELAGEIKFENKYYRKDIGQDLLRYY